MENNIYKERVKAEQYDLIDKIKRLKKFMRSDEFKKLEDDEKALLKAQKNAMRAYKNILDLRIYWEVQASKKDNQDENCPSNS